MSKPSSPVPNDIWNHAARAGRSMNAMNAVHALENLKCRTFCCCKPNKIKLVQPVSLSPPPIRLGH